MSVRRAVRRVPNWSEVLDVVDEALSIVAKELTLENLWDLNCLLYAGATCVIKFGSVRLE